MDENEHLRREYDSYGRPIQPTLWQKIKKFLAPIGIGILVLFKYLVKLKFLLPVLKTGGTMLLSIGAYAMAWGWRFAVGFVLLTRTPKLKKGRNVGRVNGIGVDA